MFELDQRACPKVFRVTHRMEVGGTSGRTGIGCSVIEVGSVVTSDMNLKMGHDHEPLTRARSRRVRAFLPLQSSGEAAPVGMVPEVALILHTSNLDRVRCGLHRTGSGSIPGRHPD